MIDESVEGYSSYETRSLTRISGPVLISWQTRTNGVEPDVCCTGSWRFLRDVNRFAAVSGKRLAYPRIDRDEQEKGVLGDWFQDDSTFIKPALEAHKLFSRPSSPNVSLAANRLAGRGLTGRFFESP